MASAERIFPASHSNKSDPSPHVDASWGLIAHAEMLMFLGLCSVIGWVARSGLLLLSPLAFVECCAVRCGEKIASEKARVTGRCDQLRASSEHQEEACRRISRMEWGPIQGVGAHRMIGR